MINHRTGNRDEWLRARLELLKAEKELTRLNDELARQRRKLPWVRLDKEYAFGAPLGRNEAGESWFRRHDQYENSYR